MKASDAVNYDDWKSSQPAENRNERLAQDAAGAVHYRLVKELATLPSSVVRRASGEITLDEFGSMGLYEIDLRLAIYSASLDADGLADDLAGIVELIAKLIRKG